MAHGACHFLTEARSLPRETVPRRGGRSYHILTSSSGRWLIMRRTPLMRRRESPRLPPRGRWQPAGLTEGVPASEQGAHHPIASLSEGEKALSWQSHGVALTAFELGNGTWSVPFPDRSAVSTARDGAPKGRKELPHFDLLFGEVAHHAANAADETEGVPSPPSPREVARRSRDGRSSPRRSKVPIPPPHDPRRDLLRQKNRTQRGAE